MGDGTVSWRQCNPALAEERRDLIPGVVAGTEYSAYRHTILPRIEVGIDILPYHQFVRCHLEHPSVWPLSDQGIPVRQPLRARDKRPKEIIKGCVAILPNDLFGKRIDLND